MRSLPLLALLAFVASSHAQTPATSLADEDTAKVLEEITKVQKEFAKTKKEILPAALERFKGAVASDAQALEFYLACYRVVNLDRKPAASKEEQEDRIKGEWREKAIAELGDGSYATVLRFQLQLLVLMLEASGGKNADESVAALRTLMQNAVSFLPVADEPQPVPGKRAKKDDKDQRANDRARKKNGLERHLRESVMGTLFAEAYNLGAYLEPPAQWPQSPADFRAAYANIIIPWHRANKKPELPVVWDEYLKAETAFHQATSSAESLIEWGGGEYKTLYWSKWLDLLNNGVTPTTAIQELVKLIHENPSHPALKTWIADLAKVGERMGGLKFGDAVTPDAK